MTELGLIRDTDALLDSVADLGTYKGDFSEHNPLIYPTDLDGIVEINGEFLIHEYKKVGAPENKGQAILQERLIQKGFTVINITHAGPAFNKEFMEATFRVPSFIAGVPFALNHQGEREKTIDVGVLKKIREFHAWWTHRMLAIKGKMK